MAIVLHDKTPDCPSMIAPIVSAADLREFRYHADGHIYHGAFYGGQLYKLVAEYDADSRVMAIEQAQDLAKSGNDALISVAIRGIRKVWVEVTASVKPIPVVWLPQEADPH